MKDALRVYKCLIAGLPQGARAFARLFATMTSFFAIFDIGALGLLAAVTAPVVAGRPVELPWIGVLSGAGLAAVVGVIAILMMSKSIFSLLANKWALKQLASYELYLGDRVFSSNLRISWHLRNDRTTPELIWAADAGVNRTVMGFMYSLISMPAVVTTAIAMILVLIVVQPLTAAVTFVYFSAVAIVLHFFITPRAQAAGKIDVEARHRSSTLISEMLYASKELTLRDRLTTAEGQVHKVRKRATTAGTAFLFLFALPKSVLEVALVGGIIVIGGANYLLAGPVSAVSAIALFGLAGFRIGPALATFQGLMSAVSSNLPTVTSTLADVRKNSTPSAYSTSRSTPSSDVSRVGDYVELKNVTFRYEKSNVKVALDRVNLRIPLGSSMGIVGPSGAGKSTLVDVLLGLVVPTEGDVLVGDESIFGDLRKWQTKIGYVPQHVSLFDASIAQNVALTWEDDFDEARVKDALEKAQLGELVGSRSGGIFSKIGEGGRTLSGGQRQRLGVARALYGSPEILVLDEATSSLDTATEFEISEVIKNMDAEITVIAIAHRLSTLAGFDALCYLKAGQVGSIGSFQEVIRAQPDFARQAMLSGINLKS